MLQIADTSRPAGENATGRGEVKSELCFAVNATFSPVHRLRGLCVKASSPHHPESVAASRSLSANSREVAPAYSRSGEQGGDKPTLAAIIKSIASAPPHPQLVCAGDLFMPTMKKLATALDDKRD